MCDESKLRRLRSVYNYSEFLYIYKSSILIERLLASQLQETCPQAPTLLTPNKTLLLSIKTAVLEADMDTTRTKHNLEYQRAVSGNLTYKCIDYQYTYSLSFDGCTIQLMEEDTSDIEALPMFFDLPAMQTFFPNVGMLHLLMISRTPRGVAGIRAHPGSPAQYLPMFS